MKNIWNKKAKRKHLSSFKKKHSKSNGSCFIEEGKVIAEESETLSILKSMLKDIVDQGGTISMNVEDGRLSIKGEVSGMDLYGVSGKEAE